MFNRTSILGYPGVSTISSTVAGKIVLNADLVWRVRACNIRARNGYGRGPYGPSKRGIERPPANVNSLETSRYSCPNLQSQNNPASRDGKR